MAVEVGKTVLVHEAVVLRRTAFRGATGDGGWFHDYVRRLPAGGIAVSIGFTGYAFADQADVLVNARLAADAVYRPDLFRAAAKESVAFQRQKWDEQEAKSLATVKAAGAEIVEVDKKSFQAVMGPVYDKFMTTPDMKRLVKAVQDTK